MLPPLTMARALSVTPVCPYVHGTYVHTLGLSNDVRSLSRIQCTFDQNSMKLGHIVKYHDVFFKLHNGPYHTLLSVVMALCL